jgi:hypothetical protein
MYKVLVGTPEGKRPFGRPRRRWEDGDRMDLEEIGLGCGLDSTSAGHGPGAGCYECGDGPSEFLRHGVMKYEVPHCATSSILPSPHPSYVQIFF